MKKVLRLAIIPFLLFLSIFSNAQVTVTVRINSGSSTTTCTDGFFGGAPEPRFGVEINGAGWSNYPNAGCGWSSLPNTQYTQVYNCPSYPGTVQVCLEAFEDDGVVCFPRSGQSCHVTSCANFATPAIGGTATYNHSVGGSSTATINFTITVTGSYLGNGNDLICNAINLGTLTSGSSIGNSNLSNYTNICGTSGGDPNPWGGNNDQGVWFQFTTGPFPAAVIDFDANSDPQGFGNNIDLQLALYASSNGTCSGALSLVDDEYNGLGLFDDENMSVNCLSPNTTYFILVDGESTFLINSGGQEGFFGIEINDNGILQAADLICNAEFLGAVPAGGSVATPNLSRSNVCATNTSDPNPGAWSSDKTVWFRFQAPPSGHVIIDADSDLPWPFGTDAIDIQLAVYGTSNGLCTGVQSHLASDYTPGLFGETMDVRCLTPGQNYWVLLDGSGLNVDGIFDLTITDGGIYPAPNDLICDAIPLGSPGNGGTVGLNNQHNYCADNIFEPIPNNWGNDQGVWYTFIAPPSGKVEIRLNDHGFFTTDNIDLQVAVYDLSGMICTGVPAEIKSEHEGIGIIWDEDMEVECLIPGREYWILVDGEGSIIDPDLQEGIFDIEVYGDPRDPASPYDLPCNALALGNPTGGSVGTTQITSHHSQNNFCAGAAGEPQPSGFTADQTVWYTFVAPSTGNVNITLTSDAIFGGTDAINLQIAVWKTPGCTGPWQEHVSGDDLLYDVDLDVYCLNPGQIYYVQIDGAPPVLLGGHEGYFDITITEIPPIPVAPNDLICNAIALGNPFAGTVSATNQHNLCADDTGDPNPSAFGTDQTVWYSFTTPATGGPYAVNINATSSLPWPFGGQDAIDLQLAVFGSSNNLCTGSLFEMESGYSLLNLFNENLNVPCLLPGMTYFVMVDGSFLDVQGYFDISISAATPVPIPVNDLICQHVNLGTVPVGGIINNNINYSNFCADVEPGEPSPFAIDQTVWFSFIAPNHPGVNATSEVTIRVDSDPAGVGNSVDLQLAVYESSNNLCTGSMNLLEDGSDDPLFSFDADVSVTCLYPGQRYWVQVDGSALNVEGYFQIEVEDDGAGYRPPYNMICNAEALGAVPNGGNINNNVNYTNLCSDTEPGEPTPSAFGVDETVWFTFVAPLSGNVTIDAFNDPNNVGDEIDLQLALYYSPNNTCSGPFLEVDSDHDIFDKDEALSVDCLEPGRIYYLQVDGSNGVFGDEDGWFTLRVRDDGGTSNFPYNNMICNAYNFGVPAAPQTRSNETNICANVELGEPGVGGYATHTVWYQFTAPPSGRVEIDVTSTNIFFGMDPEVRLFSSSNNSCTGALNQIESSTWPTALIPENIEATCLIPGNTYFIQIDGSGLVIEGRFNITVRDMYPNYGTGLAGDPEPANNNCVDAIALTVQTESCLNGSGTFQQLNYGLPTITYNPAFAQGCGGNCGDTWYQFTMPASGNAVIEGSDDNVGGGIIGDFSDLVVAAYTGTCGNLTPMNCDQGGFFSDVSFQVAAAPGTTVWIQVFNDDGEDDEEDYELCISEGCGFDNCLDALLVPMQPNVPYCFNTAGASGENISGGAAGYNECSEGDNPENSVYYYFVSDCNGSDVTLHVINATSNGTCILGIVPNDGFNISLFQDATPCDNNPTALVDCQTFTSCDVQPINWSNTYTNLQPNTPYLIQIDGGFASLGGDNSGEIMIVTTTNPVLNPVATPLSCSGLNDGTASAATQGGVPPYTFNWSNGGTDSTITNLAAGTYFVTITGANGCFDTASVVVNNGLLLVAAIGNTVDVSCSGTCDGQATVFGIGGTVATGYTYLWDAAAGGQTTATATGLCIGSYTVTVYDDNLCFDTTTAVIITPNPIILSLISSTNAACSGVCDGQAVVSASGGSVVGNYNFLWSGGQTTAMVTGLCGGSYQVTVSDDNNCTDTLTVVISEPTSVIASIANQTNILCNGDATGSVEILALNGTPNYTYTLYDNLGLISTGSSNSFTNLSVGDYGVLVQDFNGCKDSVVVTITEPTALVLNLISSIDASCFGANDGEITVQATAGSGTAPYEYSIDGINFGASGTFSNLIAGNYTLTVRDFNNCTTTMPVTINEPATINIALNSQTVASCGACDAGANITVTGGAGGFTYLWNNGSTIQDATGLCAGTAIVTVTDANTCTSTLSIPIGNSNSFAVTTNIDQAISCNGTCDGAISITTPAIGTPHTFIWNTGATTSALIGLCTGTYITTVTDNSGCFVVETIILNEPAILTTLAAELLGVSCAGLADGQATATPSGGTIPYSFVWSNGATTQTTTGLSAGVHSVTVSNGVNCVASAFVTITEPATLSITIQNTTPSNCASTGCDGSATVAVIGGQAPYTYLWSNGNTTASPINLCPNFNEVTVTDNNGCTASTNVLIPANTSLNLAIINITNPSCNNDCDGIAIVSASGGNNTQPYIFTWDDPNNQSSGMATGLCAGEYHVTVEDIDGCSAASAITITEPDSLEATAAVISNYNGMDISCNNASNGVARVTVLGGTPTFSYNWSSGQTTINASGLDALAYIVTVTDINGCSDTAMVSLTEPSIVTAAANITSNYNGQNISCNGANDGTASATAGGGTGAHSYLWSNNQTTQNVTGLGVGVHRVTITDVNGCPAIASITITQPSAITTTIAATSNYNGSNISCNGASDGTASIAANGGIAPYNFVWDNGATTNNVTGLSAGNHSVTITDNNNCTVVATVILTEPSVLTAIIGNISQPNCNGYSDGQATVTASGGIAPYRYDWDNGEQTATATALNAGNHSVTVTDVNGCSVVENVLLTEPTAIVANEVIVNAHCYYTLDGSIELATAGGTGPYTYNWSNGATVSMIGGLGIGQYIVTITDTKNCFTIDSFTIGSPPQIITSTIIYTPYNGQQISCADGDDGSAMVIVSGGIPGYTYLWFNGEITPLVTGLQASTYPVTITDAIGCIAETSVTLMHPPQVALAITITSNYNGYNVHCHDGSDGTATVSGTGGTGAYTFVWSDGQTGSSATGLNPGTYAVTIVDANGCWTMTTDSLIAPAPVTDTILPVVHITCYGLSDGQATANPAGGIPGYTYLWSNGQTSITATGLAYGYHYLTVTDAHGCTVTDVVGIYSPPRLGGNTFATSVTCNGANNGTMIVSGVAGTPGYTYLWSNNQTTATITGLAPGIYMATVTDANSCTFVVSNTITEPSDINAIAAISSNYNGSPISCNGATDASLTSSATGGAGAYTYLWSNGQTTANATGLGIGNYTITITDANGCSDTANISITAPGLLQASATVSSNYNGQNISCFGANNGSATATPIGGTAPFGYLWYIGQTTATATGLGPTTYVVLITDANGCSDTAQVTLTQPVPVAMTIQFLANTTCYGGNNGQAIIQPTNGTTPYTFLWANGVTTATNNNLTVGVHYATVTDANGCSATASVAIAEPLPMYMISHSSTQTSCFGAANGTASISVGGGTGFGTYTYLWSNGQTNTTATGLIAGLYTVTATDANGCFIVLQELVTQPAPLTLSITNVIDIDCATNQSCSATANVSGGTLSYTFMWNGIPDINIVNNLNYGWNTLVVYDGRGCSISDSVFINTPNPMTIVQSSTNITCHNGNDGTATVTATGGTPPLSYTWTTNSSITNTVTGLAAGLHYCTITDANGCRQIVSFNLSQPTALLASFTQISNSDCNNGSNGMMTATAQNGTAPYNFNWSNGDNTNNATTSTISGLSAGTYEVTISDQNGCSTQIDTLITDPAQLSAVASDDVLTCFGDNNGVITVTAMGGTLPYFYSLNGGTAQFSNQFGGLSAGVYNIEITDASGCIFATTATITQPDSIVMVVPADVSINFGETVQLFLQLPINAPINPVITWTPSTGLSCTDCFRPVAQPSETTLYTVTIVGSDACVSSADVLVEVGEDRGVYIPNAFSPNGDKTNDVFMVYSNGSVDAIEEFMIFDRWGELVCHKNDGRPNYPAYGWDGKFNGETLNVNVFVYFIRVRYFNGTTEVFTGDLTLIR